MAKIKIQIDTENGEVNLVDLEAKKPLLSPKKLGILSAIDLTQSSYDLFVNIENGYGAHRHAHHHNTRPSELKTKKDDLIRRGCEVVATVGGLFVNMGIEGDANNVPFVSLVGKIPTLPADSKCVGGVSLETPDNAARRQHLSDNKPGITDRSLIGLFRHKPGTPQTKVSQAEEYEWGNASTIFDSEGRFQDELNGGASSSIIPTNIKALVVSASPFFLFEGNMNVLVRAANEWLANDPTRFIVYPLQIYKEAQPGPKATPMGGIKRITFLGPDLHDACYVLGTYARAAQSGGQPGFLKASSSTTEL